MYFSAMPPLFTISLYPITFFSFRLIHFGLAGVLIVERGKSSTCEAEKLTNMDQKIIEKFFNNTATVEETRQVVEWFATAEGQAYLAKRLDRDAGLLQDEQIMPIVSDLDSSQMWQEMHDNMDAEKKDNTFRYPRQKVTTYWYAADIILVVATLSVFLVWKYHLADQIFKNKQQTHFVTDAYHHKAITLKDGTKI
jgi:hypothetical protein